MFNIKKTITYNDTSGFQPLFIHGLRALPPLWAKINFAALYI